MAKALLFAAVLMMVGMVVAWGPPLLGVPHGSPAWDLAMIGAVLAAGAVICPAPPPDVRAGGRRDS
jgi:hypothetical protein